MSEALRNRRKTKQGNEQSPKTSQAAKATQASAYGCSPNELGCDMNGDASSQTGATPDDGEDTFGAPESCGFGATQGDPDPNDQADSLSRMTARESVVDGNSGRRSRFRLVVVKIGDGDNARYECRVTHVGFNRGIARYSKGHHVCREAILNKYDWLRRTAEYLQTHCQEFLATGDLKDLIRGMAGEKASGNRQNCPARQKYFLELILKGNGKGNRRTDKNFQSSFSRVVRTVEIFRGFTQNKQTIPLSKLFSGANAKEWAKTRDEVELAEIVTKIKETCCDAGFGEWPTDSDWDKIAAADGNVNGLSMFQRNVLDLIRPWRKGDDDLPARIKMLRVCPNSVLANGKQEVS